MIDRRERHGCEVLDGDWIDGIGEIRLRGGQGYFLAPLAELCGWKAERIVEGTRKRGNGAVAGAFRHRFDIPIGARKIGGCTLQPQTPHRRDRAFAQHRLIDAMPVIRRKTGDLAQAGEVELLIEVVVDVVRYPGKTVEIGGRHSCSLIRERSLASALLTNPAELAPKRRRPWQP